MVTADTLLINSVLQHLVCVIREADGERGHVRYTVTGELDPELFAEVERERGLAGLSRSAAIRQALEWWIARRKERGEERVGRAEGRHRQLMGRLDFVVGMIREQDRKLEGLAGWETGSQSDDGPGAAPERGALERGALAEARKRARRRTG
jgi:hypothetical protein